MMKYLIATTILIATSAAGLAQHQRGMHMGAPATRTELEAKVRERFAVVDANRDGSFTKEEAAAARQSEVGRMRDEHFTEMDENKDGSISRAEFDTKHQRKAGERAGGMRGKRGMMRVGQGKRFDRADANDDGKVTLEEVLTHNLSRFDAADKNKDGKLTPAERQTARADMRGKMRGEHHH